MEKVLGVFKPKPTPQEQLREWQRKLRQEARNVERQVRGMVRLFAHHPTPHLPTCFPPFFRLPCKDPEMILLVVQSTGTKTSTSTTWWGLSCLHGVGDFCYAPPPVFILVFWLLGFWLQSRSIILYPEFLHHRSTSQDTLPSPKMTETQKGFLSSFQIYDLLLMMFVVWKSVFKFMDLNLSSLFLRHRIIFNLLEVLLPQIYACPQVMIGMHFIVFDLK